MRATTHNPHGPRFDADDPGEWWQSLVELYRDEAAHAPEPRLAARHLCEAGRICLAELNDAPRGRALYAEAHTLDPDDPSAARALADQAERESDWAEAREWLESALQATSGTARVSLLSRLCALLHDRLGERAAAAACAREALAQAPDDRMLLARLQLLSDADDPSARLLVLERRLDLTEDGEARAKLRVEAGRVHEAAHRDDDAALSAFRAAFDDAPDHAPALAGIVRVLLRRQDWEGLVAFAQDAVGRMADERARGRLHVLVALVLGVRLDAPERARPHLGAAAASLGHDPAAMAEIAGLYERLGLWKQANAVLERLAGAEPGLWYRIGLNVEAGGGDLDDACAAYRRAAGADAEALPALAALRRCAWRTESTEDWRRAMAGLVHHAVDPRVRSALATHLADVALHRDGDAEVARRRYADAVSAAVAAAGDAPLLLPSAFEERLRLLAAQRNLPVLEEELRSALSRPLHPASRAMVAGRLAELCEGALGRPEEALTLFQTAAEHDPDDRYAHASRQRLLWARGDWPGLLAALEAERGRADADRQRIVLTRIADVQHQMGDPEGAEATWRETLRLDPSWLPALRGLGRQLHQHGRWRDLAALHRHELDSLPPDDSRRPALLGKLAELHEFRLDQPDDAIECYEALLAMRPGAPEAVAGLERLYRQSERWAALDRVLAGRATRLEDPRARAVVLIRLADVRLERLDDRDGARAAYEEAAALTPSAPAMWALERLALTDEDEARLADLYRGALARAVTPGQKAIARHKLAAVVDPIEAEGALEDAITEGADPEAAWTLVREAAETGDAARLAARLAQLAQLVDNRRDSLALWREAAEQAQHAELPAADLTVLWERVRQLDPRADRPWVALLTLHRQTRVAGAEAELLLQHAEACANPRETSLALWGAGLIEEARGMPSVGLDAFREALIACPTDPVPAWLLLDRAGALEPADRADQLVALARRQSHGPSAAARLFEAGRIRAEELDDPQGALATWIEAVRRDPGARDAAERAEAMLEHQGARDELAALLVHRAERLDRVEQRLPLLRRLAEVQLDHLGARKAAAETLEDVVQLAPADLDARVRLGDLRYSLDQFAEAAAHYRTATMAAHDDRLLGRLYTRLGHIKSRHLGDHAGAIEDLRRAVGLGTDDQALGELAQVYLAAGESELALMAYQRLEKLAEEPAELNAARAGQVHALLRRGRRAEAVERLEAFREIDPVDPMLATLARDLGLAHATPDAPSEPLLQPPGRALSAGRDAIGAIRLERRAIDGADLDDSDVSLDALDLDPSVDRAFADATRPVEPDAPTGSTRTIPSTPPPPPEDDVFDLAGELASEVDEALADDPGAIRPPARPDGPLAADGDDLEAAFDGLDSEAGPRLHLAGELDSDLGSEADLDLGASADLDGPLDLGAGLDAGLSSALGAVFDLEPDRPAVDDDSDLDDALDNLDLGPAPSPPVSPIADRPVEAVVIPSPLDDSIEDDLAVLTEHAGTFDATGETGSLQTVSPDAATGSMPAVDLDALRTGGPGSSSSAAAALLDALPSGSVERPSSSDVVNLLQPDIDRAPSGSLTAVGRGTARAGESPSIDLDASTATYTRGREEPPQPHASGKLTVPLGPGQLAVERLKLAPLDLSAWRDLAQTVDGPITTWIDDAARWIEGEVIRGAPSPRREPLPRALALSVRPQTVPTPLAELLAELAPLLVEPVLAEGRRRTSGMGGEPIAVDAPLGQMARRYARLLGLDEMELVQNPERPYSVSVEPGDDGLRLVLGSAIVESADAAGRSFLLARTMAPVAFGTLAARQLRQRESRAFFGALFDVMGADFPLRGRDRRQVERFKAALEPYIGALDDHPQTVEIARRAADEVRRQGVAGLRAGLELFDNRLALALADGFGGAMEMLRLLDFDDRPRAALAEDELRQLVADSDIARDLIVFAATPECHAIRRWLTHDTG